MERGSIVYRREGHHPVKVIEVRIHLNKHTIRGPVAETSLEIELWWGLGLHW